jgi:DNA polymerase-3 subunit chi
MTRIEFHFNVPDRCAHACQVASDLRSRGQEMVVTGEQALLEQLDLALWTFSPVEFVPHRWAHQTDIEAPITLAPDLSVIRPQQPVLMNLGADVPAGFEAWLRLIDIVDLDPLARSAARERWRHYVHMGYDIERNDHSGKMA